jgi:hypothetical protein
MASCSHLGFHSEFYNMGRPMLRTSVLDEESVRSFCCLISSRWLSDLLS